VASFTRLDFVAEAAAGKAGLRQRDVRKTGPTLKSRAAAWMAPGVPTHGLPVSAQRTRGEFPYVHERETGYVSVERARLPPGEAPR
jgi:hypothetical protein